MLVLIATDELHDSAPTDHHGAVDGELVVPKVLECLDSDCDVCARGWFGLVSRGASTTAMVVDRPGVTEVVLRRRIHDWLDRTGWVDLVVQAVDDGEYSVDGLHHDDPVAAVDELVDAHVREVRAICANFPVGTVVSRLGSLVAARGLDAAA